MKPLDEVLRDVEAALAAGPEVSPIAHVWGSDARTLLDGLKASQERERVLREALVLADKAMNHMGDVLNAMDVVTEEDEAFTEPAFEAVRAALTTPKGQT